MTRTVLVYPQRTTDISTARPSFAFIADSDTRTLRMANSALSADQIVNDPSVIERVPPTLDTTDLDAMLRYGVSNMTMPVSPTIDHGSLEEAAQYAYDALRSPA